MIDQSDFIALFAKAINEDEPPQLTPQTRFQELAEWDSIAMVMVVTMLEEELGIYVTGDDVRPCETLEALYARLLEREAGE